MLKKFWSRKRTLGDTHPLPNVLLCRAFRQVVDEPARIFADLGRWRKLALFGTLNSTLREHANLFSDLPGLAFQWAEKKETRKERITLFCEHGWLPRQGYQISALGCNQRHHIFKTCEAANGEVGEFPDLAEKLERLKLTYPKPAKIDGLGEEPFFLFSLQLVTDLNLKRSNTEFADFHASSKASHLLVSEISALLEKVAPKTKVIFVQHPSDASKEAPALQGRHEYLSNTKKLRTLDLALSPQCRGVLTINSNSLNEALLFGLPVFQLGDFLMPKFPNTLFPYTLEAFLEDPQHCHALARVDFYLSTVLENQWSLERLIDPVALRSLMIREVERFQATN
jgi:hypothetical protein